MTTPSCVPRPIWACVWDLDGTLLDTETLSTEAIQAVLDRFEKTIEWDVKKTLLGLPGSIWPQMVVDAYGLGGRLDPRDLHEEWQQNLLRTNHRVTKMDGALEAVTRLYELNVPMAIATSSNAAGVSIKSVHNQDIFQKMRVVVTGDDPAVAGRGKPEPDIFLEAARRLGVAPETNSCVLCFEDSLSGAEAALRAGMHCICVPDPRLDREPFRRLLARHEGRGDICRSLQEVDWASFEFRQES